MGGKAKQRVKHNAKPSSSSRSAEQMQMRKLQDSTAGFDPFAATSEKFPLVAGFALESLTENFDSNVSSEFQLVLKKMSKKDPLTKKKALTEFVDLVNQSELETLKSVLPLWPRHYKNLAADTDHMVRELTQTALRTLVSKCKRAIAPYLKQIMPTWLLSQFDNYAPAATIAAASFKETFVGSTDRTQEVLLHCNEEILEQTIRNLTFHTASTLSNGKDLAPEEAEQKYHRAVVSSLKALSLLIDKTTAAENSVKIAESLQNLVQNQKFWSLSKTKHTAIRAAWFEFIYNLLQSTAYKSIIDIENSTLITLSFQNIDDADAVVASYAWACVLTIQTSFNNWYLLINLRKAVLPKLYALLRNGFNGNAVTLCPNLLPFFSNMTQEALQDFDYIEFCRTFFAEFQHAICNENMRSKAELNAIIKSYFECLRYLYQKLNAANDESFAFWLLNDNIIVTLKWLLEGKGIAVKCYFQQLASLIAYWAERCCSSQMLIYNNLLDKFWQNSLEIMKAKVNSKDVSEVCMERLIQFLQDLCLANASLDISRNITFCDNENLETVVATLQHAAMYEGRETTKSNLRNKLIEPKLKEIVIQLLRLLIENLNDENAGKQIKFIHSLIQLFTDSDFHKSISHDGNILTTVKMIQNLCNVVVENQEACELANDIMFNILQNMTMNDALTYIKGLLTENTKENIKILLLERLLSHPYCNEGHVRTILAQTHISALIIKIAKEAVSIDNNKEKFIFLHKCFFQVDNGDVLINRTTVDGVLETLCEALFAAETQDSLTIQTCSSFLAQTMPVFCVSENASKHIKEKVFLCLFEFTMKYLKADEHITEETLWEIATSWQDALSSGDIQLETEILQNCSTIVAKYVDAESLESELVDTMANLLTKFIVSGTERISEENERLKQIDLIISVIFKTTAIDEQNFCNLKDLCTLLEASKGIASVGTTDLSKSCLQKIPIQNVFKRALLNVIIIKKLICKIDTGLMQAEDDDEGAEDNLEVNKNLLTQWPPKLLTMIVNHLITGAIAESFLTNNLYPVDEQTEWYLVTFSETVKLIMANGTEMITTLVESLMEKVLKETNISVIRTLKFFIYSAEYSQFEESATIVLAERLSELLISQAAAFESYVYSLQYLMPNLAAKALTMRSAIMQSEPHEDWIKFVMFRLLIENNFNAVNTVNDTVDKAIPLAALQFITNFVENNQKFNKENFLYNTTIETKNFAHINSTIEYINLYCTLIQNFPYQLTIKNWDALRLGLSSWTLSVSKSYAHYKNPNVFLLVTRVFHLYEIFKNFILKEKQKSSTSVIGNVIEEWENLFAREVELVLFNFFVKLCNEYDSNVDENKTIDYECYSFLMNHIIPALELIDYNYVYTTHRDSNKLDVLYSFVLKQLSNKLHCIRMCAVHILREITKFCVAADILTVEKTSEMLAEESRFPGTHFLNNFDDYLTRYGMPILKYLDEFSFKLTEISEFGPVDRDDALSYLLLWDCIIYVCANSPLSLRSIYTSWLHENRYEEHYIHFLFRCMPIEVLKNYDSKIMGTELFKGFTFAQMKDSTISTEKLACHLYTETLRKLPAIVRKWWNTCPSRQKTFVDKLTTNFVSSLICNEELKTIANRKDKHENMQVTVHYSTREVLAVYSIDEARMELVITLAPNYPLGSVKIECGKQIGGRGSSRNIGMQLSIFLTHQNGTICDGLTLWKSNLDKKFDGVEECYICYTVIHHETFRLPKLSCKTCKKKFHGPCLYKWFTTSSKSTCPICRNVF